MLWKVAAVAGTALALFAPAAHAQAQDVARGTATQQDGADTISYDLNAVSGPSGEGAAGLITRVFTGTDGTSTVVADVTCLAVEGNRAAVIGRVRPDPSVGFEALLVRVLDGTPQLQPDAVSSSTDPRSGGEITLTDCAGFLDPFPVSPISTGDFVVIDGTEEPPPPPPPPPPACDEDDDDQGDDDQGDDDQGDDDDQGCEDDDGDDQG